MIKPWQWSQVNSMLTISWSSPWPSGFTPPEEKPAVWGGWGRGSPKGLANQSQHQSHFSFTTPEGRGSSEDQNALVAMSISMIFSAWNSLAMVQLTDPHSSVSHEIKYTPNSYHDCYLEKQALHFVSASYTPSRIEPMLHVPMEHASDQVSVLLCHCRIVGENRLLNPRAGQ